MTMLTPAFWLIRDSCCLVASLRVK